jgi:hypothetical protein
VSILHPMRRRDRKRDQRGRAYLAWLHGLSCALCASYGVRQYTPTEAAHVGRRGLGQKCSDMEAVPLCAMCHREGAQSHHRIGRRFEEVHGVDLMRWVQQYNQRFVERES